MFLKLTFGIQLDHICAHEVVYLELVVRKVKCAQTSHAT